LDLPPQAPTRLVAPPALAPGLHHCCARAKPVSCGGDWAVLRLYATPRFIWLVAPPALAPGLQQCSLDLPPQAPTRLVAPPALAPGLQQCSIDPPWPTRFGSQPTSAAAVNLMTRVSRVSRPPGLARGLHHCSAPHKAAHQQTAMKSAQRNDWFVAPPPLAPGYAYLRRADCTPTPPIPSGQTVTIPISPAACGRPEISPRAPPRSSDYPWRLGAGLKYPPALAPGLQPCSTNPPSGYSGR
jgi:hypothetical protein